MLEFAVPEIGEVFSGKKFLLVFSGSFQQNLLNNPVGREETFLQTFLIDYVEQQFSVPTFCGSVWKSWRESPNC